MSKIIFHIDINAFFASVEEIINPNLKTKPIGICSENQKTVLSTCNYVARKFGVRAAMKSYEAKALCPGIIFVKPKYYIYEKISKQFINLLKNTFTTNIQIISIDECFMDVTDIIASFHNNPNILALQIQNVVLKKIGLPISIGISESKFLAKVASNFKKPLGIETLYLSEIEQKFLPLGIEEFVGIGKQKIKKLHEINIYTINDLKTFKNEELLIDIFGNKTYQKIIKIILGENLESNLDLINPFPKSISKAITLSKDEYDLERILKELKELSKKLGNEINYIGGYNVTLIVKYSHKEQKSKSVTFKNIVDSKNIFIVSKDIFLEI